MRLNESMESYSEAQRSLLLNLARQSIAHGIETGNPFDVISAEYDPTLQEIRSSFVTLRIDETLRGCMGSLIPKNPLVEDVSRNAFNASKRDPRFEAVIASELPLLHIHISVLSPAIPIEFTSIEDLFEQIRPNVDGLIVRAGKHTGTLLPAVWSHIPDRREFWTQLLKKAGLPAEYQEEDLKVLRYTAESFSESE